MLLGKICHGAIVITQFKIFIIQNIDTLFRLIYIKIYIYLLSRHENLLFCSSILSIKFYKFVAFSSKKI